MSRTPIYHVLKRLLRKSQQRPERPNSMGQNPPGDGVSHWSRRRFLKTLGAAAPAAMLAGCGVRYSGNKGGEDPSIAVIGGGIAGLTAVWQLREAGLAAELYEAGSRLGGRMYARNDLLVDGALTEIGGEFINSDHEDMLHLAEEFGIPLVDNVAELASWQSTVYLIDNERFTEEAMVEAFAPYGAMIAADYEKLEEDFERYAVEFDQLSVQQYLQDRLGMNGWLYRFFASALAAEFGLDVDQQTALNMIWILPFTEEEKMHVLGESDERYRLEGGTTRLFEGMAQRIGPEALFLEHQLETIRSRGKGFELVFKGGRVKRFDYVILTVPFSVIREKIDQQVRLGEDLSRCIQELRYGTNSKLMAGFAGRPWRDAGYGGGIYASGDICMAWDNTLGQSVNDGGLTFYYGGSQIPPSGRSVKEEIEPVMKIVEELFPGLEKAQNGRLVHYRWESQPLAKGSYACWGPGQYTSILESMLYYEEEDGDFNEVRAGNLIFAGEHCSDEYQGYMNGGAQTGRLAAQTILRDRR